jgi:proteasome lid subunit RPN8/RPN11
MKNENNIISKIIIHKNLINKFKRDALFWYPHEHIQAILGKQRGDILYAYCLVNYSNVTRKMKHNLPLIYYALPDIEMVEDTHLTYLGGIHSHPGGPLYYSSIDRSSFLQPSIENTSIVNGYQCEFLQDKIMGIMQVSKLKHGCQYGIVFYNLLMQQIPYIISEVKNKGD